MINRSNLIGKPLYHLLLQNNATVITCHSKTENLHEHCKNADIIITAVGDRTKFKLTSDMIKQDAIVIDVAISRYEGKLVGDADYDDIIQKSVMGYTCSWWCWTYDSCHVTKKYCDCNIIE